MIETRFPVLMEMLHLLVDQKRYYDAENLLREAREYAAVRPPGQDVADLVAEASAERFRKIEDRLPTARELAGMLTQEKLYFAATQPTVDNAILRLWER